jgi:formylglycine-generating enzyme required for sulfatase activity
MGLRIERPISSGDTVMEVWRGGFSEVARLHHPDFGDRALKRIKDDVLAKAGEQARTNFRAEAAKWLALLAGAPHVAQGLFFWPSLDDLGPVLFLEYVDGPSVAKLLSRVKASSKEGRLSASESFRILAQTAEALAFAHLKGFNHRDVKPGNILLTSRNEVRVVDWGIAAAFNAPAIAAFTPEYSSARKLADPQWNDPRDDLYSLGIVVYQCLTGDFPPAPAGRKAALRQAQLALPDQAIDLVLGLLDDGKPMDAAGVRDAACNLIGILNLREAENPRCKTCGIILHEKVRPCPVCGQATYERIDKSADEKRFEGTIKIPGGPFTAGIDLDKAKVAFQIARIEVNARNLAALGFDPGHPASTIRSDYLPTYYIDRYPVTNQEYASFCEKTLYPISLENQQNATARPSHPVTGITWKDAFAYAAYHGKRLPTGAEWEKCARGDQDERAYPWGNNWETNCCNDKESPYSRNTTPVDFFTREGLDGRSPYGVADLAGNVSEFVADGEFPNKGTRGGGYTDPCMIFGMIGASRVASLDYSGPATGFRCACDPEYVEEEIH